MMEKTGRNIDRVHLEEDEKQCLQDRIKRGKGSAQSRSRAQILLWADEHHPGGRYKDKAIADSVGVGTATVERVRQQCVLEGVEATVERKVQENRKPRTLDGESEAKLVMLACSKPPEGHAQWSLKLLSDKWVEREIVDTISTETVRRSLKKTA